MITYNPIIQKLKTEGSSEIEVLRLDLLHNEISGNKWFKLKCNLEKARSQDFETILTFGGAFSNHIAATASACRDLNFKSIGIIRGDENEELNPTLKRARENGMQLHFVSREFYAQREEAVFQKYIAENMGKCYVIPEGGNNREGLSGCREILNAHWQYDYIFCACGTGTTYAGLFTSKKENSILIGVSVLKGEHKLPSDVKRLLKSSSVHIHNDISGNGVLEKEIIDENCIINSYAFKGYARYDQHLVEFKKAFESEYKFELDHVYTVKLFYAVLDLLKRKKLRENSKILIVHSGGLQGNTGFEERYHLIPSL